MAKTTKKTSVKNDKKTKSDSKFNLTKVLNKNLNLTALSKQIEVINERLDQIEQDLANIK